jgi:RNA polymerase sigma-70 factor (ECF subfamily)
VWRAGFQIAAGLLKERGTFRELTVEPSSHNPERAWHLIAALAELPHRQRASVVLHHYAGYPVAEIGRILGTSSPAVRMNLTRGRRRLRVLLEEGDDD